MLSKTIKSGDWKGEKHVPVIHVDKEAKKAGLCHVKVLVGEEIPHPNTLEHHIAWMKLFFVPNGKECPVEIASYEAKAHGEENIFSEPYIEVRFKSESEGNFYALSYCNIHGLWESEAEF